MCVDKAHLVLVSLGDTDDHVVDLRNHGANASDLLASTEPHTADDGLGGGLNLEGGVVEVTLK